MLQVCPQTVCYSEIHLHEDALVVMTDEFFELEAWQKHPAIQRGNAKDYHNVDLAVIKEITFIQALFPRIYLCQINFSKIASIQSLEDFITKINNETTLHIIFLFQVLYFIF